MNGPGVIAAGLSLVFITSCGGITTLAPTGPSSTLATTVSTTASPTAPAPAAPVPTSRLISGTVGPLLEGTPPCFADRYACEVYDFSLLHEGSILGGRRAGARGCRAEKRPVTYLVPATQNGGRELPASGRQPGTRIHDSLCARADVLSCVVRPPSPVTSPSLEPCFVRPSTSSSAWTLPCALLPTWLVHVCAVFGVRGPPAAGDSAPVPETFVRWHRSLPETA